MNDAYNLDPIEYRDILLRHGFVPCDIPACNCNSWHPRGGFYARFKEIEDAVEDATGEVIQGTLLDTVRKLARDAERWRAIAPYLTAGKIGGATCVSLSHIFHFDGDMTAEQVVDRLVDEARKKP